MVDDYQLAEGHDAQTSYVLLTSILISGGRVIYASSLSTFATGREIVTLDGGVHDDGFLQFEWRFAGLTVAQFKYIKDTFLDGERSGLVTARTVDNDGVWHDVNATLTLQRLPTRVGQKYGDVLFAFTVGELAA